MNKLTSKHFTSLIFIAMYISLRSYPSLFLKSGGRDTWIFTLIASFLIFFYALYIINVSKSIDNFDFKNVCLNALGQKLGTFFIILFSFGLILVCVECTSTFSNSLNSTTFLETPTWYCAILFVAATTFMSLKDFRSVLSISLVSVCILLLTEIAIFALSFKFEDYTLLLPILHNVSFKNAALSTFSQLGALSSLALVIPYIGGIEDRPAFKKYALCTILIMALIQTLSLIGLVASFGHLRVQNLYFPRFTQAQRLYYNGFLETGEIFEILNTVLAWTCKYILAMTALKMLWKDNFKTGKVFTISLGCIIFLASCYISKSVYTLFYFLKVYQFVSLLIFFVLTLIVFIVYNIRYKQPNEK